MSDEPVWPPVNTPGSQKMAIATSDCVASWCVAPIIPGDGVDPTPEGYMHSTCAKDWRVESGDEPDYIPSRDELIAKWTIFDRTGRLTTDYDVKIEEVVDAVMASPFFGQEFQVSYHLERGLNGKLVVVEDSSFPFGLKGLDQKLNRR